MKTWRAKFAFTSLLACLLSGLAGRAALAQARRAGKTPVKESAATQPAQTGEDGETKVRVERGAGGKKVYRIEGEIRIEGKIQKPEAFYVLQKSSMNYDWQEMRQDFLPKIVESVRRAPF